MKKLEQAIAYFEDAIKEFKKAIELDPAYFLAYKRLGVLYTNIKEYKLAIENFEKYISLISNEDEKQNIMNTIERLKFI